MNQETFETEKVFLNILKQFLADIRAGQRTIASGKTNASEKLTEVERLIEAEKLIDTERGTETRDNYTLEQLLSLCKMAKKHNLLPLMVSYLENREGINLLELQTEADADKDGEDSGSRNKAEERVKLCKKLTKYYFQGNSQMGAQMRRTHELERIYQILFNRGISPILMKGLVCRSLYGEYGEFRPSADEDLLIRPEEYEEAREILCQNGYRCELGEEYHLEHISKNQEVTFYSDSLTIELHLNVIGLNNTFRESLNELFLKAFDDSILWPWKDMEFRTMSFHDHMLFLIVHAAKHLSGTGVGIRQFLDILLFAERYQAEIDWETLWKKLSDHQLDHFFNDVLYVGNFWLGFDFQLEQEPCCPEQLLDHIFQNGIFGKTNKARKFVMFRMQDAMENTEKEAHKRNKLQRFLRLLLPTKRRLAVKYPIVLRYPCLIPFFWLVRIVRFGLKCFRFKPGDVREGIQDADQRLNILKLYGIL